MRVFLIVLFIVQLLAAAGCYPQDVRLTRPTPVRTVDVLEVRAAPTRDTVTLLGLIEPIQEAILYFEVTGQVRQVFVSEGDIVEVGAPLAELVPDDFQLAVSQASAELTAAQARLDLLRTGTRQEDLIAAQAAQSQSKAREIYWAGELSRRRSLHTKNAVSLSEVDEAISEYDAALERERETKALSDRAVAGPRTEEIEEAAATVELRTHALALAKRQLQKATLRAPCSGRVEKRMVDPGAVIPQFSVANVPIVQLVDLQTADAVVAVPESVREFIHGQSQVEIASAKDSSLRATGTVVALGQVADRASGTCALRVRIDNSQRRFYSGMVVTAAVERPAGEPSIHIPLSAVRQPFGQSPQVLLLDGQNRIVAERDIRLGELDGDEIEVTSGLSNGEQVIVRGQHLVVAGDRVQSRQAAQSKQEARQVNLSAWSIRNPKILMLAVVILSVWGLAALWDLARQEDPAITWRLANVVTRFPGASPARVESLITDVIERYVRQVDEVEHIYSVSRSGVSLVQIELSDEVRVAAPAWQKVRQKLDEASREVPPEVIGPTLDDEIMGTFTVLAAITGEGKSYRELKDYAQRLEDQWRYLPEAASTSLFGVQPEVIQVELDAARLAADELSFPQVAAALRHRNSRQPSGRLRIDGSELQVEASGEFESAAQIADMFLHVTADGNSVKVRDVAQVNRTTQTPPEPLARYQGKPAVVVGVRCRQAVRIDHFGSQALAVLDRFRDTLPAGVHADVFQDLGRCTREREHQLVQTLIWSTLGVFLSTAIFLNWRACLVIASAMPLTGLIVMTCFSVLHIPLDQMSVMAAIMAMGLLVDNAILVTEQIERRVEEGVDVMVAAAREPHALFIPLAVSTLTTVAAFVPIYLLPGGVGEFVRAIPVGMGVALLASLLVAMTVTPWMATQLLGGGNGPRKPMIPGMDRVYQALENRLMWLLERVLRRPGMAMAIATAIVVASFALGLTLRRDFFSPVQRNQFVIDVFAPQGSPVTYTSEIVQQIEAQLVGEPGVASVASFIGSNAPLVFYNLQSQETYAAHFSQLIVTTDDWSHTMRLAAQTQRRLDAQIADAHCCVHIFEHGAPFVAPFEVRISGPAIEALDELGRRASTILKQTQGVRNVRTNYGNSALKLMANVNEPLARAVGIDQNMVADELRNRLDGLSAGSLQEDDERIEIVVRLPAVTRHSIADLERIYFKPTAQAGLIPFSTVATLTPTWETASIYRRDSQRTLSVLAYPEFGQTAADVSRGFVPALNQLADQLPPGYRLELGGENEQRNEAETNLFYKGIYGVTIVVLLVMIEFRSIRLTLLIGCVVVFSMAGGVVALWLTRWPLNFMALMGMAMHAGVADNDATVLVDELERRRHAGESGTELVLQGTRERIRHVVITSTAIGGYLPLAFSESLLWPPMAIVMIGGLALSTLLTLVVVPAGYMLLRRP